MRLHSRFISYIHINIYSCHKLKFIYLTSRCVLLARNKSVLKGKKIKQIKRLSVSEYFSYLLVKRTINANAIAVVGEEKSLTFAELDDYSTRLAKVIRYL